MNARLVIQKLLRAQYTHVHHYDKDEAPERRGTGPLRHRHGAAYAAWCAETKARDTGERAELRVEWSLFNRSHSWLGWTYESNCGEKKLHLGFGFLAVYWSLERWPQYRELQEREWSVHYDLPGDASFPRWGALRWRFGCNPMEWSSRTPKWRDGHLHPYETIADAVLGKERVETTALSTHDVLVPMPEGTYPAVVTIEQRTCRRARIPWPTHVSRSAGITIPGGIPVPGKGENSYDCGDDGIYGTGSSEPSVAAAIASAVRAATEHRLRYGGPEWKPPAQREGVTA